jgi:hypothetical protein
MSEQDTSFEEDPSIEWIYNKETDMWISPRQQIAIEGSIYRRMVSARAADALTPGGGEQQPDRSDSAGDQREG